MVTTGKSRLDTVGDMDRLERAIASSGLDAGSAVSPENVIYASDVFVSTQIDIRDRLALIGWAAGRDPVFVLCQVEEGFVRQESWIGDIRTYKEFSDHTIKPELEKIPGVSEARVGVAWDAEL